MSDALEQHRKECEEMRLASMIWWLILWHASDEGKQELPSEHEWLICELVAAVIEEVTNEKWLYSWRFDIEGNELHHDWRAWPYELNMAMVLLEKEHVEMSERSTEGKLRLLLKRFAHLSFQSDHDEKDYVSELRWFHENHTPRPMGRSRFTPTREMYEQAVEELLRFTSAHHTDVCEWCRKIGMLIRPYIERDIAYIKSHYSW